MTHEHNGSITAVGELAQQPVGLLVDGQIDRAVSAFAEGGQQDNTGLAGESTAHSGPDPVVQTQPRHQDHRRAPGPHTGRSPRKRAR